MTQRFINGAKYAVSNTFAAAVAISALTNANPAVATSATVPAAGAILLLNSGWTDLNESVARSIAPGAGVFSLEGVDTTNVVDYPVGEGIGTYQTVTGFVGLSQVREASMKGGEQQYFDWQYLEDKGGKQRKKPTFKNAYTMEMMFDYDPDLPWYDTLVAMDRATGTVVLRETLPSGDVIYYNGTLSFNKVPTKNINENMTVMATFSLASDPVRFGA